MSETEKRSHRLFGAAAVSATVGVNWLMVWFITDRATRWLHDVSQVATIAFIAMAVVFAGYVG